jgi:hypothetical protein
VDTGPPAELVGRHAAEATIRFSLRDHPPGMLDSLGRIDGVRSVDRTGAHVVVRGERRVVAHVCAAMVACESVPADLRVHVPTLEDALLGLLSGESAEAAALEGARA